MLIKMNAQNTMKSRKKDDLDQQSTIDPFQNNHIIVLEDDRQFEYSCASNIGTTDKQRTLALGKLQWDSGRPLRLTTKIEEIQ